MALLYQTSMSSPKISILLKPRPGLSLRTAAPSYAASRHPAQRAGPAPAHLPGGAAGGATVGLQQYRAGGVDSRLPARPAQHAATRRGRSRASSKEFSRWLFEQPDPPQKNIRQVEQQANRREVGPQ